MDVELGLAGLTCVGLAAGHATIGLVWVLPRLAEERLPSTPFGPPSMTAAMIRVTWHVVTIFCLTFGALLVTLARAAAGDPEMLLLRGIGAAFLAATAIVVWVVRRRPRHALRLPVPLLFVVVAALCWSAST